MIGGVLYAMFVLGFYSLCRYVIYNSDNQQSKLPAAVEWVAPYAVTAAIVFMIVAMGGSSPDQESDWDERTPQQRRENRHEKFGSYTLACWAGIIAARAARKAEKAKEGANWTVAERARVDELRRKYADWMGGDDAQES